MAADPRPNMVFIMAEQFGANVCPGYGNEAVGAPHLRALRRESITFDACYTPAPVCGPARLAFLTGCYSFRTGAYDNGSTLDPSIPTFGHLLTAAGYETALCGRMHIHGLDQHRGFEHRPISEIIDPRPGTKADWPGRPIPLSAPGPAKPWSPGCEASDSPLYRHDACVTAAAGEFLRERGPARERPFMLTIGYLAAHPAAKGIPELVPLYEAYMKRDDLPCAHFTREDFDRLPEHAQRRLLYGFAGEEMFDPEYQRHETALYYARCTYLDRQVGQIRKALAEAGLDDTTYLFFSADHGDNAGAHGLWGKMAFHEESQRVPMLVRCPGGRHGGLRLPGRISLIDLLPTFGELAGARPEFPVDGISFAASLATGTDAPRGPLGPIFSEYHGYLAQAGMYMLLRDRYKYCYYAPEPDELYDLLRDPGELDNLLAGGARPAVRDRLEEELRAIVDIEGTERRVVDYNRRRQAVFNGLAASRIIKADSDAFVRHFREQRAEAWWDGGAFMANEFAQEARRQAKAADRGSIQSQSPRNS